MVCIDAQKKYKYTYVENSIPTHQYPCMIYITY
jgi:hypothetical protein